MTNVADPLGGSAYVEWMTDEMERQATEILDHLLELGDGSILEGVYEGIDNGWFVGGIADSAYRFEREVNDGTRIIVGVNAFTDGDDGEGNLMRIEQDTEDLQLKRLARGQAEPRRRDGAPLARSRPIRSRRPDRQPHAAGHRRSQGLRHRGRNLRHPGLSVRPLRRTSHHLRMRMPCSRAARDRAPLEDLRSSATTRRLTS